MTDDTAAPVSAPASRSFSVVALVGFMGAGKTTAGQALAARLGWQFCDLDRVIEKRDGRSVAAIFEQAGEESFRMLEREALQHAIESSGQNLVLALGGGAFACTEVRRILAHSGIPAVFLDAPVEELFRRCEQPGTIRPLRRDLNDFRALYERRYESYLQGTLRVETGGRDIASIVGEIINGLKLVPSSGVCD
jgi:shikimate kinase